MNDAFRDLQKLAAMYFKSLCQKQDSYILLKALIAKKPIPIVFKNSTEYETKNVSENLTK